jgi:hypothetical protein
MNLPTILILATALILAYVAISRNHFQPELLDQGNVIRTQEKSVSSYHQSTNSVPVDGTFDAPPIQGVISPFRVNMYNSYIP